MGDDVVGVVAAVAVDGAAVVGAGDEAGAAGADCARALVAAANTRAIEARLEARRKERKVRIPVRRRMKAHDSAELAPTCAAVSLTHCAGFQRDTFEP